MNSLRHILNACLPAALVGIFAFACGNFQAPLSAAAVIFGHLILLGLALAGGSSWRDPLALGKGWSWLPWSLWLLVALSWWRSPVHRAGTLGLLLAPVALLGVAALASCWREESSRRRALRALAMVLLAVAGAAWIGWWRQGTARPALPLGHHNLLAAWLVGLLPLVAVGWRDRGHWRWLIGVALAAAGATLLASRSLSGALALVAALGVAWALRSGRRSAWWMVFAALVLVPQLSRLTGLFGGTDASAAARLTYLRAGWQGFLERPGLGWGPGSTGWTVAEHLQPSPGVHPADQAVAELHSLPMTLLYELGLPATLLALGLVCWFGWSRFRDRSGKADSTEPEQGGSGLRDGALTGVVALLVASLGGLPLSVTALVVVAMVLASAALGATTKTTTGEGWPAWIVVGLVAGLLRPYDLALWAYQTAALAESPAQRLAALERAHELDAAMPLYGFRLARELDDPNQAADLSLRAAEGARGVAALWLNAAQLATGSKKAAATEAWQRACDLAPLGAMAPLGLALADPYDPLAVERLSRVFLASPELRAAYALEDHEGLVNRAVDRLSGEGGIEQGWRWALYESWLRVLEQPMDDSAAARLVLRMDGEGAESISLHVFRRRPWSAELVAVELSTARLQEGRQTAASDLPSTSAELFAPGCRLPQP